MRFIRHPEFFKDLSRRVEALFALDFLKLFYQEPLEGVHENL
jgi:hypothetical protein